MKINLTKEVTINDLVRKNKIKNEWSMCEHYGIDTILQVALENQFSIEELCFANIKHKGLLVTYIYNELVFYDDNDVSSILQYACIHQNGNVILFNDFEDAIAIIDDSPLKVTDFN